MFQPYIVLNFGDFPGDIRAIWACLPAFRLKIGHFDTWYAVSSLSRLHQVTDKNVPLSNAKTIRHYAELAQNVLGLN